MTATAPVCDDELASLMGGKFTWSLDFEDVDEFGWIRGWDKPDGQTGRTKPDFELDESVTHSGRRSLRISMTDASVDPGTVGGNVHAGPVAVTPGGSYTISFWAKGENVVSQTYHLAIVQKTGKQEAVGVTTSSSTVYCFGSIPTGTYDWTHVTETCAIPADHDAMFSHSLLFQDGSGTVWLDDIVFMPATQYADLPATTLEVETRSPEPAAPARHYFLREEPVTARAVLRDQQGSGGTYTVSAELKSCGQTLQSFQQSVIVGPHERVEVPLVNLPPGQFPVGDYLLAVKLEQDAQVVDSVDHPVGFRVKPRAEFFFGMGSTADLDPASALARMDRLKASHLSPLFYSGEPSAFAADAALSRNLPFTVRLMPSNEHSDFTLPKKKRSDGGEFPAPYDYGLSDDAVLSARAQWIGEGLARTGHFPAFFPRVFTSDDFIMFSGWDWAEGISQRFEESAGMKAPTPDEFTGQDNPLAVMSFSMAKGMIGDSEPWPAYNRFLSGNVLGEYNKTVTAKVVKTNPGARIGPISAGSQWPLFNPALGQYPPLNFGEHGFNMISYYLYLSYWQPLTAYVYWTDISRMGNRDLPVFVMPDAFMPEPSYHANVFYLLLASGVDGLAYYIDGSTAAEPYYKEGPSPEFLATAKNELGPLTEEFGSLFTQLKPADKQVGLLASFTTSTYKTDHPLHLVCAYSNLLLSHADVETVSEEEIRDGRLGEYDALVLSDVDWLPEDVAGLLMNQTGTRIILDPDSEVQLAGDHVYKTDFAFAGACAGSDPDYAKEDRLATIRTELDKIVPPAVVLDKDTVIQRKFTANGRRYLWLVDVNTHDEFTNLFGMLQSVGFNLIESDATVETVRNETTSYLAGQGVYDGATLVNVELKTDGPTEVIDVFSGQRIPSTFADGWTIFPMELGRLQGKLISY